jgi:hypothetical protein
VGGLGNASQGDSRASDNGSKREHDFVVVIK